jgi:biopolymer transport protein ExbD
MFFLLASFMMVSLTMQRLRTLNIDLPSAAVAKPGQKPDLLEISLDRAGDFFIEGRRFSFTEFNALLRDRLAANANLPVYLKPGNGVAHGTVVAVLDGIRAAGVRKVSVAISADENP